MGKLCFAAKFDVSVVRLCKLQRVGLLTWGEKLVGVLDPAIVKY
jgi:hypothetical protein